MIKFIAPLLFVILVTSIINAEETNTLEDFTLTNISFNMDEDGNLNPNIFIPVYYGSLNQFYSAIGFSSTNEKEVETVDQFSDSKNAFVSSSKDLTLNYITYRTSLFGYEVFIGAESTFSDVQNNEFGYIHDSNNDLGNGSDYYIAFDNSIELNIQRHTLITNIIIPTGKYFSSRVFVTLSPYAKIKVKQSTIFKPLIDETGTSSGSTVQDLSYTLKYNGLVRTGTFFNIGLVAYYDNQSYQYDIAKIFQNDTGKFEFRTENVDTTEITTGGIIKLLLDINILGELNPSIGYGIEKLNRKNNLDGTVTSTDKTFFTIGFEKMF